MFPGVVMINSLYWMIFGIAQILIIAGGYAWLKSANKSVKAWQMAILYGTFASFLLVIGGGQYNLNKFVFKGNVYGGMNAGLTDASHLSYTPLYGAAGLDYDVAPGFEADGNEYNIQNTIDYGVSAEIGYKVTPKIISHVGAGYAAYVNTDIIAYPGVIVTPEIAYYNTKEDTKTQDTETGELLYGVKVLFLIM